MPRLPDALPIAAAALSGFLVIVYATAGGSGHSVETSIEIAASPETVWSILTETTDYGTWNPVMQVVDGTFVEGGQMTLTLSTEGSPAVEMPLRVLVADEGLELRWQERFASVSGVFDGEHFIVLEQTAEGNTIVHHGETFSGVLTRVLFHRMEGDATAAFNAINLALKVEAEAAS